MSKLKNRINFSVMVVVGLFQTIFGIHLFQEMDNFVETSHKTNGTVVELHVNKNGLYAPVVEFVDTNGVNQVFTSNSASRPSKYEKNQIVDIIYKHDIANNIEAHIFDEREIFIKKYALLMFGVMFIFLGITFGSIFWNRDSMHISFNFSKEFGSKIDSEKTR